MTYTLGTAAKATGKSKPTIQRAITSGKISAKKNENGPYAIDPAEMHRVYPPVSSNSNDNGTVKQTETPNSNTMLQREIELLREQLDRERDTVTDLRRRLDAESEERRSTNEECRKLTMMLTDMRPKKKTALDWLFGIK